MFREFSLSVIICTKNRPEAVARLIGSLASSDLNNPSVEIILVDNNSDAEVGLRIKDELKRVEHANVVYLLETKPGVSCARNRGLAGARGDLVFFTDDDCLVQEDHYARIMRKFSDPAVSAAAGDMADVVGDDRYQRREQAKVIRQFSALPAGDVVTACLAFRTEVGRVVGFFDTNLGAGARWRCEDADYAQRMLRQGFDIHIDPDISVLHRHDRVSPDEKATAMLANDFARGGYHAKYWLLDWRHLVLFAKSGLSVGRRRPRGLLEQMRGAAAYMLFKLTDKRQGA